MQLTEEEKSIHYSIERIKDKVRDLNKRYETLTNRDKERLALLEIRLKHYIDKFEHIELHYGILL